MNQIHDFLAGCESNVDDTPSLDFRFNFISPVINIHIVTIPERLQLETGTNN